MRFDILLLSCLIFALTSCGQIPDPLRNKIDLRAEIGDVADSIIYIEALIKKLPASSIVGSFMDDDGYLYVNSKKIGLLENALADTSMINNVVFRNLSQHDYQKFISITIFLLKNHIDASGIDNITGLFTHQYRITEEYAYRDLRYIMVNVDTTSRKFNEHYQILDRRENMMLVAPIDIKVK
jgi:hypothetical protein